MGDFFRVRKIKKIHRPISPQPPKNTDQQVQPQQLAGKIINPTDQQPKNCNTDSGVQNKKPLPKNCTIIAANPNPQIPNKNDIGQALCKQKNGTGKGINKADGVSHQQNAKDADNVPKNGTTGIDSMLHKTHPNTFNMQTGEIAELAKLQAQKNGNAENVHKRTSGIDSMLHQPRPVVFTDNEVNGGEAGVKEKTTKLQEGFSRGKGVLNMVDPRIDFRAPATTVAADFDTEMLDAPDQIFADGTSGNIPEQDLYKVDVDPADNIHDSEMDEHGFVLKKDHRDGMVHVNDEAAEYDGDEPQKCVENPVNDAFGGVHKPPNNKSSARLRKKRRDTIKKKQENAEKMKDLQKGYCSEPIR